MSALGAILLGALAAVLVAAVARRRAAPAAPATPTALERELRGLDAELAAGDIAESDYRALRAATAARLALSGASRERATRPRRRWVAPVAAVAAAAVIVGTLVPALRSRGAGDYATGNDFAAESGAPNPALDAWQDAERALRAGRPRQAVERYRMAVAFESERADLRSRFGLALMLAGRPSEAARQLRLALASDDDAPGARLYLGAALVRAGRRAAARRELRRYLASGQGRDRAAVRRILAAASAAPRRP